MSRAATCSVATWLLGRVQARYRVSSLSGLLTLLSENLGKGAEPFFAERATQSACLSRWARAGAGPANQVAWS